MEDVKKRLKVYCETTFWSYLAGRQTTDEKIARDQAFTLKWWQEIALMTTSKIDYTDPKYQDLLEEVYAIRREISEQYGHDIHRLFEGLREWQREQEANGVKFNFAHLPIVRHQPVMA